MMFVNSPNLNCCLFTGATLGDQVARRVRHRFPGPQGGLTLQHGAERGGVQAAQVGCGDSRDVVLKQRTKKEGKSLGKHTRENLTLSGKRSSPATASKRPEKNSVERLTDGIFSVENRREGGDRRSALLRLTGAAKETGSCTAVRPLEFAHVPWHAKDSCLARNGLHCSPRRPLL